MTDGPRSEMNYVKVFPSIPADIKRSCLRYASSRMHTFLNTKQKFDFFLIAQFI